MKKVTSQAELKILQLELGFKPDWLGLIIIYYLFIAFAVFILSANSSFLIGKEMAEASILIHSIPMQ